MNLKEIREMIDLMNENDLTEIEIEREGTKIKIKRGSSQGYELLPKSIPGYQVETHVSSLAANDAVKGKNANHTQIQSPMVGTFYRAPSPEAPVFVEPGQIVEIGQVVCIVEAMKLMNEIKSEVRGKVVEVMVNNGDPVEFGQPLFSLE